MRRIVTLLAVAALVAGCGSKSKSTSVSLSAPSKSTSHARTQTTPKRSTSSASSSPRYPYPAAVKNALMTHCLKGGSHSACDCVVRYFEGNFSFAQVKAASVPKLATWAAKAASICSGV
jgi:uncharacterized protein YceK